MNNVIRFSDSPRILHAGFVARLTEANEASRQLRRYGCRVIRQAVGIYSDATEIVVDRNPHQPLIGCPNVHVTCGGAHE